VRQDAECAAFWDGFTASLAGGDPRRTAWPDAFGFGGEGPLADELAALVLAGRKRATASLPVEYTALGEALPVAGDLSIVLDGTGHPVAIIERTSVQLVAFEAVDAAFAAREGEGDGSLAAWRQAHAWYFGQVFREWGGRLQDDTPVLCQCFQVVWPPTVADARPVAVARAFEGQTISPAEAIAAYLRAKDGNRPYLLDAAFAPDVQLRMVVRTDAISFPPASVGREALAETLVRRFNQEYENVHSVCLGAPPPPGAAAFGCRWLVAMSARQDGAVRVGCGSYDWAFAPADGRVAALTIRIDAMEILPPDTLQTVMAWAAALPSPWCPERVAVGALPALAPLRQVAQALQRADA
jgi:uncharacterized protein YhfF